METKSLSAFFLLSLLMFQFVYVSDARNGPGDYWKSVMAEVDMPKAIQDLLDTNPISNPDAKIDQSASDFDGNSILVYHPTSNPDTKTDRFARDFDGNSILFYHGNDAKHKPSRDLPDSNPDTKTDQFARDFDGNSILVYHGNDHIQDAKHKPSDMEG